MMSQSKILAAVVVNHKGDILPYTVSSTVQQCEEDAIERWGDTWLKLTTLGAKVVQCEIVLLRVEK